VERGHCRRPRAGASDATPPSLAVIAVIAVFAVPAVPAVPAAFGTVVKG
jgi:hypothetical protein